MTDITIYKAWNKSVIIGSSAKGRDWLRHNALAKGKDFIVDSELVPDLVRDFEAEGLLVDVK